MMWAGLVRAQDEAIVRAASELTVGNILSVIDISQPAAKAGQA